MQITQIQKNIITCFIICLFFVSFYFLNRIKIEVFGYICLFIISLSPSVISLIRKKHDRFTALINIPIMLLLAIGIMPTHDDFYYNTSLMNIKASIALIIIMLILLFILDKL